MLTVNLRRLNISPGTRVLDIGCGNGRHGLEALKAGAHVTATDLDRDALAAAARTASAMQAAGEIPTGGRFATVVADACQLPLPDGHFDVAIASEVLEHISKDEAAIVELCRVLRPGGVLAVTVPRWWPERLCWALSRTYHNVEGGHIRIYRRSELVRRLERAGFVMTPPHHHAHALHTPYWWLRCAVGITREHVAVTDLYHRLLVYDLMRRPRWSRWLESALNPVLGKSVVVYARRPDARDLVTP